MIHILKKHWKIIASFVIVGLVIYLPSIIINDYVDWDDHSLILERPELLQWNLHNVWILFTSYDPDLYIPLTFLSYQFERIASGGNFIPQVSHAINLFLHIGSALLIVGVASRLTKSAWVGFVTGVLFLVHPLHTEAIAWASARKDVLATLFFLASIWWYQQGKLRHSIFSFLLALLSKVIVVTLPVVLLLIDWREGRRIDRHCLVEKIPYVVLSIAFGFVAINGKEDAGFHIIEKLLIGSRSILFYLEKILAPTKLAVLYPFTEPITISNPELFLSVIGVVLITCAVFFLRKRSKELVFAWAFFLVTVFPTLTNFTKGDLHLLDVYIASDRYAYIPSIAILFIVALVLNRLRQTYNHGTIICVTVIILLFSYLSFNQSLTWRDTGHIHLNIIDHYDNSHIAHNGVGIELESKGLQDEALVEYKKSLSVRPNEKAYYNLGRIFAMRGMYAESRLALLESLKMNPNYLEANLALGQLMLVLGKPAETIKLTEFVLLYQPTNIQALTFTAEAYRRLGDIVMADKFAKVLAEIQDF